MENFIRMGAREENDRKIYSDREMNLKIERDRKRVKQEGRKYFLRTYASSRGFLLQLILLGVLLR